jgi:hypothetical protein
MNTVFYEQQYFRQIWLWVVLIGINSFFIYGLVMQLYYGRAFGDNPTSNMELVALTVVITLISNLFVFMRLETTIDRSGIHYRFFPFQWSQKTIAWNRISKVYVRQYNPIAEYGGWGLRLGLFGKGKAFNVSGSVGIQLVYDNGKKFLIGTQQPKEVEMILRELGYKETNEAV